MILRGEALGYEDHAASVACAAAQRDATTQSNHPAKGRERASVVLGQGELELAGGRIDDPARLIQVEKIFEGERIAGFGRADQVSKAPV